MSKNINNKNETIQKEHHSTTQQANIPCNTKRSKLRSQKDNKNEEVSPRKTCKNKSAKVNNLTTKMNKTMFKTITKIKTSRQLYIQSQHAQNNVRKRTNNCAQHIPKHCVKCKSETRKNMHH